MPLLNATKAVSCAGLTRASMRRRNRSQLYVRLPALNQGHGLPGHGAEPDAMAKMVGYAGACHRAAPCADPLAPARQ